MTKQKKSKLKKSKVEVETKPENKEPSVSLYEPLENRLDFGDYSVIEITDCLLALTGRLEDSIRDSSREYQINFKGVYIKPEGEVVNAAEIKSLDGVVDCLVMNIGNFRLTSTIKFNSDREEDKELYFELCKIVKGFKMPEYQKDVTRSTTLLGIGFGFVATAPCINYVGEAAPLIGGASGLCGGFIGYLFGLVRTKYKLNKIKAEAERYKQLPQIKRYEGPDIPPAATLDEEKK